MLCSADRPDVADADELETDDCVLAVEMPDTGSDFERGVSKVVSLSAPALIRAEFLCNPNSSPMQVFSVDVL